MTLSLFTPTHDARYLRDAYESIREQPFDEWVVLYNGGACPAGFDDPRVREVTCDDLPPWVGALKRRAVEHCTGDILLELDHDDLLAPDAIAEVRAAFEDPDVGFVYSNTVHATLDLEPAARFAVGHGWQYRPAEFHGQALDEAIAFEPTPAAVSRIWYAPNHVRAFRREAYERAGGYSDQMRVLDDEDLMCRLYRVTRFHHIDKPLYIQRGHPACAQVVHNAEIQANVYRLYDQYTESLALTWAKREGLRALDLGGRFGATAGYETVDRREADVCCDLERRWPFEDGSVGVVRAFDVFEHLRDTLHTMRELYRVLAPGGYAIIQVPSTDGRGAFQDPTHCSWWNENSFLYYTHRDWAKYIDTPVRFQALRLYTTEKDARQVCWVRADLLKLAEGLRVPGPVEI